MHIERLTSHHIPQWAGLLALCFERSSTDMVHLLDWFHLMYEPVSYGIWLDDQLVAQYTALFRQLDLCGAIVSVGMSVNMAVHPEYRGRGLVKHMANPVYDLIRERGGIIGMGFSNAEGVKVDKRSKGYGYRVVGQMHPLIGWLRDFNVPALETSDVFPQVSHFAISKPCDNASIQFPKDALFLSQRYGLHPFRQYQYAIWRDGDTIEGLVVYRYETIGGISAAAILDVYGNDVAELLKRWSSTTRQEGVRMVHVLASPQANIKRTLSNLIPVITMPYALTPYYLTAKPLCDDYPPHIDDFAAWNLIGGDVL